MWLTGRSNPNTKCVSVSFFAFLSSPPASLSSLGIHHICAAIFSVFPVCLSPTDGSRNAS